MEERFVVELENNHHYILVDLVTGYSYYTPAQMDANSLCGILNDLSSKINNQRHHIKELENTLQKHGLKCELNRECRNCDHICMRYLDDEDSSAWCELRDRTVGLNDYCKDWVLLE